jgi:hypothetical protein
MLRVPFIPTAYPDETLGSLLTRLVIYNGKGLWRSLLENSGYGRRTISPFYSIPPQDHRIDRLLNLLGYSYQDMTSKLTTLPFWLSFNNTAKSQAKLSITKISNHNIGLSLLRRRSGSAGAHYCPTCLIEDTATFGEPYLHRQHQLPVSLVCATHGDWLRITCPACGIVVLPLNRELVIPAPLRCQCGYDLTIGSTRRPQRDSFRLLSQFAASTLSCHEAHWSLEQTRAALEYRTGITTRNFIRSTKALLSQFYGPLETSDSELSIVSKPLSGQELALQLRGNTGAFQSPEYCALLTAAGLTFEDFKSLISSTAATELPSYRPPGATNWNDLPTITVARQKIKEFAAQSLSQVLTRFHNHHSRLYWLLRLRDEEWLREQNYGTMHSLPSLENDRAKILRAALAHGRALIHVKKGGSWMRATVRDNIWLEKQLNERLLRRKLHAGTQADNVQLERAIVLSRAIFSILRSEKRPRRIHSGLLSKAAHLTMFQAQKTISKSPQLQMIIEAVNLDKDRRLAAWATREILNKGQRPSPSAVLVYAGLVTTKVNRQHVIDAIGAYEVNFN